MALRALFDDMIAYFQPVKKDDGKYLRYLLYAGLGLGMLGLTVWGYRWYRVTKEEQAQEVFSSCMREYDRAEQDPSLWGNAELVFRLGAEQNQGSSMLPYFLAYQAEALLRMGKDVEARDVMDRAVAQMSSSSPIYSLYATKQALMMMDAAEADVQTKGLEKLTKLAHDDANLNRDMALYYLGLYHWAHDDIANARVVWADLAPLAQQEPTSPWARRAQEKIEQVVA